MLKIRLLILLLIVSSVLLQTCKKPELESETNTAPGAPTGVTATAGNAQATVTFSPPANDGGSPITGYTVTSSTGGLAKTGTASPITITGLDNGTTYTFTVTATNAIGSGPASAASNPVTPFAPTTVPGPPTGVTATAANAQATVSFTPPSSDGGSPITVYTVTSSPGSIIKTGTASPITVTGLVNGTQYTFTVTATNINGSGTASAASNSVTPSTVPGAPTGVMAIAGNAQATVSFTVPASNGGSPITGYTVTSSPGGFIKTGTASPITVTGLNNGTQYTFTVTATNINGNSLSSTPSNIITPSLPSQLYDIDNNVYNTITIGGQVWMLENLKTTKYSNGASLNYPGTNDAEWQSTTSGAYAWYNHDETTYKNVYGALYNWYAVNNGNLCPSGWHVPSVNDWTILADYLANNGYGYQGSGSDIGKSLASVSGWNISSTPGNVGNDQAANNTSGFTIKPAGSRDFDAIFRSSGMYGTFWSSGEKDLNDAWTRFLYFDSSAFTSNGADKHYGFSVRCLKN